MAKKEYRLGKNDIYAEEYTPDEQLYPHPLLFVHGSFGGFWMWNMIIPPLVEEGFRAITFSLRGHKPSKKVDLGTVHMSDYVADVQAVRSELKLDNPVLIGHSMGGLVVLMYAAEQPVGAVVSIDPSPSKEVQGEKPQEEIKKIPPVYTPVEAGMPTDTEKIMRALPDISKETLIKMKGMLGAESGTARKDRKRGISIAKESLTVPVLFVGAQMGDSVPFGISLESTKKMADYYGADFVTIEGATHPGIIAGKYAPQVAEQIAHWLKEDAK